MDSKPDSETLNTPRHVVEELIAGLLAPQAFTNPKFLYDALGSRLFDAITELPEYYPTRTEAQIFARHASALAQKIGPGATLIDLGAGSCEKAARLFGSLKPAQYVAVDISESYLYATLDRLQREHPALPMRALGMDFSQTLDLPADLATTRNAFFYPGSSIGNFTPEEATAFMRRIHAQCHGGGLIIGVDLVKSKAVLEPAYDDAVGVTTAFNLNMLMHVNRLIGSDFAARDWQHRAIFNAADSRIEMHLTAKRDVHVTWPSGSRSFRAGEHIHTENSYKYTLAHFEQLLRAAGFKNVQAWTDERQWFSVWWAS